ncbi:TIGR01548 family HAD-type hydrolase [cf. Phormidesmis sp. LEGE 11477]|uniref:TIGR01548 family HAD-type hydrolase n=1 Tax=cf. Phormidesmis sp. LEGE 11477 TaxID=1828680 RepID=UPI00187E63F6|nr:TIGR01548 family HAD-type hydrolase [cf. Phormidesmis sp. LEGE 11477]MBE9060833.1 TIGR01548 family HAD-type hydrolase [cf. Phormidesmis sp. LEGE 11477]
MKPTAIAVFDIDGVIRDVGGSYRRAIADTVEHYTNGHYRPTIEDIDQLKSEGIWNNDWKASEEMISRYYAQQQQPKPTASYEEITDYFQKRYRGPDTEDADQWTGYISSEPLLVDKNYLATLSQSGVPYAFFSGATQGSANFVLQRRIGLKDPILVAMEDAPSKPDPTGLMMAVRAVETRQSLGENLPVIYAGDTAADMKTIVAAKQQFPEREWLAIGILPPHAQKSEIYKANYAEKLKTAGALIVIENVRQCTAEQLQSLL